MRHPRLVAAGIAVVLLAAGAALIVHRLCGGPVTVTVTHVAQITHPTGASVVWVPGLNGPCRVVRTTVDEATAAGLASAVDHAPKLPGSARNCPNADASAALLDFHHAGTHRLQLVVASLSGCTALSAPGRQLNDGGDVPTLLSPLDPFPPK